MNKISFRGGETTGSVSKVMSTAKQETSGSVGYQPFSINKDSRCDSVSFRSCHVCKNLSMRENLMWSGALDAITSNGQVYANQINLFKIIQNFRFHNLIHNSEKIKEPLYNFCS